MSVSYSRLRKGRAAGRILLCAGVVIALMVTYLWSAGIVDFTSLLMGRRTPTNAAIEDLKKTLIELKSKQTKWNDALNELRAARAKIDEQLDVSGATMDHITVENQIRLDDLAKLDIKEAKYEKNLSKYNEAILRAESDLVQLGIDSKAEAAGENAKSRDDIARLLEKFKEQKEDDVNGDTLDQEAARQRALKAHLSRRTQGTYQPTLPTKSVTPNAESSHIINGRKVDDGFPNVKVDPARVPTRIGQGLPEVSTTEKKEIIFDLDDPFSDPPVKGKTTAPATAAKPVVPFPAVPYSPPPVKGKSTGEDRDFQGKITSIKQDSAGHTLWEVHFDRSVDEFDGHEFLARSKKSKKAIFGPGEMVVVKTRGSILVVSTTDTNVASTEAVHIGDFIDATFPGPLLKPLDIP